MRGSGQSVKGQSTKKNAAASCKQNSVSSPLLSSSNKAKTQKQQTSAIPSCSACGILIGGDVKALQCDRCQATDMWKCADCLNLPPVIYDHLVSDLNCSLRWFCLACDKSVMEVSDKKECHGSEKFDNLATLVENLLGKISSLMERYETIEQKLEDKCSVTDVVKLGSRLTALEPKVYEAEHKLSHIATLETRVNILEQKILTTSVDTAKPSHDHGLSDEDLIKFVVQEELNKKTEDGKDLMSRQKNVIFHRVPEKRSDKVEERRENDLVFVTDLLDGVFNIKLEENSIEKMFRLGRWSADKDRPLLVTFKDLELREAVMSNLRKLRNPIDKFRGVGISPDLHPKEREDIRNMIEEAKQLHTDNESEDVGNFRFLVVGKGHRRKVIKIRRSNSSVQG